jgi:hypothetical protein
MNFGEAIQALKEGKLVSRSGWNGKGMFIFMRPSDEIDIATVINVVKSIPASVKEYYDRVGFEQGLIKIKFTAYICMKAADGTIVNGWLASQTDMLAEDWEVVEYL